MLKTFKIYESLIFNQSNQQLKSYPLLWYPYDYFLKFKLNYIYFFILTLLNVY